MILINFGFSLPKDSNMTGTERCRTWVLCHQVPSIFQVVWARLEWEQRKLLIGPKKATVEEFWRLILQSQSGRVGFYAWN